MEGEKNTMHIQKGLFPDREAKDYNREEACPIS